MLAFGIFVAEVPKSFFANLISLVNVNSIDFAVMTNYVENYIKIITKLEKVYMGQYVSYYHYHVLVFVYRKMQTLLWK